MTYALDCKGYIACQKDFFCLLSLPFLLLLVETTIGGDADLFCLD